MIVFRFRKSFFGDVTSRVVTEFPATIGRDPSCDVWIDDSQVSAKHAEIHRQAGRYLLRNLSTTNGLRQGRRRVESITFEDRCSFFVGRLRIDAVAKTLNERTQEVDLRWRPRLKRAAFAFFCFFVSATLCAWVEPAEMDSGAYWFVSLVMTYPLLIGGASGFLALWSKLQTGRYRFFEALWMCAFLAPWVTALILLGGTVEYNWPWRASRDVIVPLLRTGLWGFVIAWALRFVFQEAKFRNVLTAVLVVFFLIVGAVEVAYYADDTKTHYEFNGVVGYPLNERFDGGLKTLQTAMEQSANRLADAGALESIREKDREARRRDTASTLGEQPVSENPPKP